MGTAVASGPDRATKAADAGVACPLLEGIDRSRVRGVLMPIAASQGSFKRAESLSVDSSLAQPGGTMHAPHSVQTPQQHHCCEGLNTPSVWRTHRTHAAARVDALASNRMDEIEVPAFLRKQAD